MTKSIESKLQEIAGRHSTHWSSSKADTLQQIQALIQQEVRAAEHKARLGLLEYFDQIPSNDVMDWKGLIVDCKQIELGDQLKAERTKE